MATENNPRCLQLKTWRKQLGLKQKELADMLGLKKRMIQYYERGERNGKKVLIPKAVRLACYAISNGIDDFDFSTPKTGDGVDDNIPQVLKAVDGSS